MPIECSYIPNGGKLSKFNNPIEAGESRAYRDFSEIGKMVVITCFEHELFGRVSHINENQIITTKDGIFVPHNLINGENSEIIYPEVPYPVPVKDIDGEPGNLVFKLFFPAQGIFDAWSSEQVG